MRMDCPAGLSRAAAAEWEATAWHEAGHAVASVMLGLPLHDASIWWQSAWWSLGWLAKPRGLVRATDAEDGGCHVDDGDTGSWDKVVIVALAGPEAEARRVAGMSGRPLAVTRAEAELGERDGDFRDATDYLRFASLTREQADQRAAVFVTQWWDAIRTVAGLLQAAHTLTAAEIREAITTRQDKVPPRAREGITPLGGGSEGRGRGGRRPPLALA